MQRIADGLVGNVHDLGDFADAEIFVVPQCNRFQLAFGQALQDRYQLLGELFFVVVNDMLLARVLVLAQESIQLHLRENLLLFGNAVNVAAEAPEEVKLDIIDRGNIGVATPEIDKKVLNSVLHASFVRNKALAVRI